MKLKIAKEKNLMLLLFVLAGYAAWPYWNASALATSRSTYLIWSLSSSFVVLFVLSGVSIILWSFFQNIRTTMLVIGIITLILGASLYFSAPNILAKLAPGLQQKGTASWLKTPIHEMGPTLRPDESGPDIYYNRAIAVKLQLENRIIVQALNFTFVENSGFLVEVYRDNGGAYWVGDPTKDNTRKSGVLYILIGSLLIFLSLISRIGTVRRFISYLNNNFG